MALRKQGPYHYADSQEDIREEIVRYSGIQGYLATHFADASCPCGGRVFRLSLDDVAGVALRKCVSCSAEHLVSDSADYIDDAEPEECACPCAGEAFEITAGVSLYEGSEDVRWLYLCCRCVECGLTAVYGDWKNEFEGYSELLARI